MLESEEEDESEIVGSASGADSEKIRILSSRKVFQILTLPKWA